MFALLLQLLTRYSFAQVVAAVAVTTVATVAVAGSADVVSLVERVAAAAAGEDLAGNADAGKPGVNPALAVLASAVTVDPNYTLKSVTYRMTEVPTTVGAIAFRLESPEVIPESITIQAVSPTGAFYRCSFESVGADLSVTCDTKNPALPVAQVNRLYVEIKS
ncbi:MAG: hypothetical protein WCI61_09105 [Chloroflexota bacterium]